MILICDTCSVLMLIRIAPEMFCDPQYECVTINKVYREIFQSSRFKNKYPWRAQFKSKIITLGTTAENTPDIQQKYKIVENLAETKELINKKTGRSFDLSKTDKEIAACALALKYAVSTVEHDLTDFLGQEFDIRVIRPLAVINYWLRKGIIEWDEYKQGVLEDWAINEGATSSKRDIQKFEELTVRAYPKR